MGDIFHWSFLYLGFSQILYGYTCSALPTPSCSRIFNFYVLYGSYNLPGYLLETSLLFSKRWHYSSSVCFFPCLEPWPVFLKTLCLPLHLGVHTWSQPQNGESVGLTLRVLGVPMGPVGGSSSEVFSEACGPTSC